MLFDSSKIAPKDEEEMEDFHDYEDEEQGAQSSKPRRVRAGRGRGVTRRGSGGQCPASRSPTGAQYGGSRSGSACSRRV